MSRYWLFLLRLSALFAVAFSCALMFHYLSPADGAFCGEKSACEVVRKSPLGTFGPTGLLPGLGVVGYVAVFWLSFHAQLRRLLLPATLLGAAFSVLLFGYQAFVLHAFCWLCISVELMSLGVAACAFMLSRASQAAHNEQWDKTNGWAWFVLLALSLNAANLWLRVRATDVLPAPIAELQQPNVVTVVEFSDFECPHCRRLHSSLKTALDLFPQTYRVVRYHVPLNFHVHAEGAARAAICAERLGHGDAMADRLFKASVAQSDLFKHAAMLGLPEGEFRACFDAPATRQTIAEHRAVFQSVGGVSVPLTFIGEQRLQGNVGANVVAQALDRATKPRGFRGFSPLAFGALLGLVAVLVFVAGTWLPRRESRASVDGDRA